MDMDLAGEIRRTLNYHSRENASNTPDFVLSEFLMLCLEAFEESVKRRDSFNSSDQAEPEASQPS